MGLERWQDRRQPSREHGLARARWAHVEQMMRSGRRDLEGAARQRLSSHLGQVFGARRLGVGRRGDLRREVRATQPVDRLMQAAHGVHREPPDQRRLGGAGGSAQQGSHPRLPRRFGQRQGAAHPTKAAVQGHLSQRRGGLQTLARGLPRGREDPDRHGQVGGGALFAALGGGQVHGDLAVGKLEAGVPEGRPDPITRLATGQIGQPDQHEARQAGADVHLALDREGLEPPESCRAHGAEHGRSSRGRIAGAGGFEQGPGQRWPPPACEPPGRWSGEARPQDHPRLRALQAQARARRGR